MMVAVLVRGRAKVWVLIVGGLVLMLLLSGCWYSGGALQRPAQQGVLDLSSGRFASDGAVRLSGEWTLFWEELLEPSDLQGGLPVTASQVRLPGSWKGLELDGRRLPGTGYATLRLRVLLPPAQGPMALNIPHMITAHKLWVNGRLVSEAGMVARDAASSNAQYSPRTVRLDAPGSSLDLVMQVSNYEHRAGGLMQPLVLGDIKMIATRERTARLQMFALGGLLFLGVHYLFLCWLRPQETALLKLGLTGLIFVVYLGVVHDLILTALPGGVWWEVHRKIYYIGPILAMYLTIAVMQDFFPQESGRLPVKALAGLAAVLTGLGFSRGTCKNRPQAG